MLWFDVSDLRYRTDKPSRRVLPAVE